MTAEPAFSKKDFADLDDAAILDSVEAAKPYVAPAPAPRIRCFTLEELLQTEFPPRENLLAPWLPAKGIAMAYSPRGVGKTHFGLACAYAVASGGDYLKWKAPKPRKVLLLDGEMPAVTLQERLAIIAANAPTEPPPGYVRLLPYDLFRGRWAGSLDGGGTSRTGTAHRRCRADRCGQHQHHLPEREGKRV
jgi:hypothetical protein